MLQYNELMELALLLQADRDSLQRVLDHRNNVESKAHALFTEPLGGQIFAHTPEQCDPIGFVTVLREAFRQLQNGKKLANPFIYSLKIN